MALGKTKRCSSMKLNHGGRMKGEEEKGFVLREFVRHTRSFGRKRILISKNDGDVDLLTLDSCPETPPKKFCSGRRIMSLDAEDEGEKSSIERLPQDILIKILCGVDHKDLKQLFHVSKAIREATVIAKKWHFAYSTPTKIPAFRARLNFGSPDEFDEIEAPNAPKQSRAHRSRLNGKKSLADISVALFASPTKKGLFMETEWKWWLAAANV